MKNDRENLIVKLTFDFALQILINAKYPKNLR